MKLLDDYFRLQRQIHDYFGYVEDWVVIPLDDNTNMYWRIIGGDERGAGGTVRFAQTRTLLDDPGMNYYSCPIYTQRFLPKWIYRGEEYTMVCADTQTDGNKFLMIFSNDLEVPDESDGESTDLG